jgi:hypothetical protein
MPDNLEKIRIEIEDYLHANRFTIFRGVPRNVDDTRLVYWDVAQFPTPIDFLKTAEETGVRLLVLHSKRFDEASIEELETALEGLGLPREERRPIEKRIKDLNVYLGMTSEIEMSYAFDNQVYVYLVSSDWSDEYEDLYEELMLTPPEFDEDDEDEDPPMGGFFSKN